MKRANTISGASTWFLLLYLWESVLAKTVLGRSSSVWRVHMVLSLTLPALFLAAMLERPWIPAYAPKQYLHDIGTCPISDV